MSHRSLLAKGRRISRPAFTLVEILVVISILCVLIALLLPALANARQQARTTQCLSNLHGLGVAWLAYATDREGELVCGDTSSIGWVNSANGSTQYTTGTLYPYVKNAGFYYCPNADNESNTRSYSINEVYASDAKSWVGVAYRHLAQVKNPTNSFVFIEEFDPRGYNEGGFVLPRTGTSWVDFPAHRHGGSLGGTYDSRGNSCCLNFADAHAECWKFDDSRTLGLSNFYADTPNDSDLIRLQNADGW